MEMPPEKSIAKNKKIILISICIFLIYSGLSIAVYMTFYDIMKVKNIQILSEKVQMVKEIISLFNETSKMSARKIAEVFSAMFTGKITIDNSNAIKINDVYTPALIHNNKVLNLDNSYVNRLAQITGGSVATIFVRKEDDFIRIATSLKMQDGTTAVGTNLGKSHPGYKNLMKGDAYSGKANLFGRDYMTKYTPIKSDSGEIIGVLFVGYDITDALKSIMDYIMSISIVGKGFFFIIDENNDKTYKTLLAHFYEDEQKGNTVLGEIVKKKEGISNIKNDNLFGLKGSEKTLIYTYYKDWNWIIGIGVSTDMIVKEIVTIRNIMIVVGLLAAVLVCSIFFLQSLIRWFCISAN